jgi:putative membrane protein
VSIFIATTGYYFDNNLNSKTMRSFICFMLIAGALACKNNQQDSVRIAKEANKDKADTGSNITMNKDTVTTTMAVEKSEADFAVEAANGNMIDVQLSALAKTKAVNSRVKQYASMIIKDHEKLSKQLQKIATDKNITLPQELSNEARNDINRLSEKDRASFDGAYMRMMLNDHKKYVDNFEKAAKDCKDPALKDFIHEALPVLKKHRDSAAAIEPLFVERTPTPAPVYP